MKKLNKYLLIILGCLLLCACKVDLYTDLREKEANEMLAILMAEGVSATKQRLKDGGSVTLSVAKSELTTAIQLLNSKGYPKEKFTDVGTLFKKDGLISSPLEEKARYIFGLSQQISETLAQLDGVITSRVQVVQPETGRGKENNNETASASVFIKYSDEYDLEESIPKIKMLVANSVEGLDYENISVALFPSRTVNSVSGVEHRDILSIKVGESSAVRFWLLVSTLGALGIFGSLGSWILWTKNQALKNHLAKLNNSDASDKFPLQSAANMPDVSVESKKESRKKSFA